MAEEASSSVLAGRRAVLELLRAGRPAERILLASEARPSGVVGEIRRRAEAAAVPVRYVPRRELERVAAGINHQGVVALTGRYRYATFERLLAKPSPAVLFLDGITDPHNLGSLLRSADGAGFDGVVVSVHRSVGVTAAVRRVSAGAAEFVDVARVRSLSVALDQARKAGLWVLGLDERAELDMFSSKLAEPPVGIVLGSEDKGMSRTVAQSCDELVRIPTRGRLASLNVAVAGAIAMFEVARKLRGSDSL